MTIHKIKVPENHPSVTTWLYLLDDIIVGRVFKKGEKIISLEAMAELGETGEIIINAPCNGIVRNPPNEDRLYEAGDTICTFGSGVHYVLFCSKDKIINVYKKFPRLLYALIILIALVFGCISYLLITTGSGLFLKLFGMLIGSFLAAVILPFSFLMILGKQRGKKFLKLWLDNKFFWGISFGILGLLFIPLIFSELLKTNEKNIPLVFVWVVFSIGLIYYAIVINRRKNQE